MKQRLIAVAVSLAVASSGCASMRAQRSHIVTGPAPNLPAETSLMASYVRQLPIGSRVRVTLADGSVIRGTLMKADADPVVVQKRTRIPEPPLQIQISHVRSVEVDKNGGGPGRAIAIGAAAGAGAALGVLMILAAIFAE
jgi:hypothetical protein